MFKRSALFSLIGLIFIGSSLLAQDNRMGITWWSVESGGQSNGNRFSLNGVIGQSDASIDSHSDRFRTAGGFLPPIGAVDPPNSFALYLPTFLEGPPVTREATPTPTATPTATPTSQPEWQIVDGSQNIGDAPNGFTSMLMFDQRLVAGARQTTDGGAGFYLSESVLSSPCMSLPSITRIDEDSRVYDIAQHGGILYAATYSDRLDISTDGGGSWNDSTEIIAQDAQARSIAVLNSDIWVATEAHGLYRSTDAGDSWSSDPIANISNQLNTVVSYDNRLWIGTLEDGIQVVDAEGANPSSVGSLAKKAGGVFAFGFGSNVVYIGTDNGVYRRDGNAEWEPMGSELQGKTVNSLEIVGNVLYAGTTDGVWFSQATGTPAWQRENSGTNLSGAVVRDLLYQATICPGLFAATDKGIYYLTNPKE